MITQEMIEEKVVDYIRKNNRNPQFVLLDRESFIDLNRSYFVKERFPTIEKPTQEQLNEEAKRKNHDWIMRIKFEPCWVKILTVVSDYRIFEVVG